MSYAELRYNQVRQKSAHNAFQQQEGIYDQVLYWRVRSLELDLHRSKLGHGALKRDWYIYHGLHNPSTTVHRLSDFLRLCHGIARAIPRHEVITVFLDIREPFHTTPSASQSGVALDRLLLDGLGEERIHRPADILAGLDGTTLREAVTTRGWPRLAELRGKLLFVMTGDPLLLRTYVGSRKARDCAAFVSGKVDAADEVPGDDEDVVFFNMNAAKVALASRVHAAGLVGRAYYINDKERWKKARAHDCHHIATDHVNAREDSWSQTASPETGFPFQSLTGGTPRVSEPGEICGVWARSGDIWGEVDSFYYNYADCAHAPGNRYQLYVSGANSFGEDWLKGGLIARASLAGDAAYFGVFRIAEHHRLRVQYRVAAGGTTVAREKSLGAGVLDEDTLVFVRLHLTQGGHRARAWGSVDGLSWNEIASFEFDEPLRYQGVGVSSHGESAGAKFMFGVPNDRPRPPFTRGQLIGPRGDGHRGGADWSGAERWRVGAEEE